MAQPTDDDAGDQRAADVDNGTEYYDRQHDGADKAADDYAQTDKDHVGFVGRSAYPRFFTASATAAPEPAIRRMSLRLTLVCARIGMLISGAARSLR